MKIESKHQLEKQLKIASAAIDLIKMSQRTQHTSIKEALRKILRCVSMIADSKDLISEFDTDLQKKIDKINERENHEQMNETKANTITSKEIQKDLIKQAEKIAAAGKIKSETKEGEVE